MRTLSGRLGHLHRTTSDANTFACFRERTERLLSASRALENGVRDALSDLVRFAARRPRANPIERHLHIGECAAIEVFVNHIDPPEGTAWRPGGGIFDHLNQIGRPKRSAPDEPVKNVQHAAAFQVSKRRQFAMSRLPQIEVAFRLSLKSRRLPTWPSCFSKQYPRATAEHFQRVSGRHTSASCSEQQLDHLVPWMKASISSRVSLPSLLVSIALKIRS